MDPSVKEILTKAKNDNIITISDSSGIFLKCKPENSEQFFKEKLAFIKKNYTSQVEFTIINYILQTLYQPNVNSSKELKMKVRFHEIQQIYKDFNEKNNSKNPTEIEDPQLQKSDPGVSDVSDHQIKTSLNHLNEDNRSDHQIKTPLSHLNEDDNCEHQLKSFDIAIEELRKKLKEGKRNYGICVSSHYRDHHLQGVGSLSNYPDVFKNIVDHYNVKFSVKNGSATIVNSIKNGGNRNTFSCNVRNTGRIHFYINNEWAETEFIKEFESEFSFLDDFQLKILYNILKSNNNDLFWLESSQLIGPPDLVEKNLSGIWVMVKKEHTPDGRLSDLEVFVDESLGTWEIEHRGNEWSVRVRQDILGNTDKFCDSLGIIGHNILETNSATHKIEEQNNKIFEKIELIPEEFSKIKDEIKNEIKNEYYLVSRLINTKSDLANKKFDLILENFSIIDREIKSNNSQFKQNLFLVLQSIETTPGKTVETLMKELELPRKTLTGYLTILRNRDWIYSQKGSQLNSKKGRPRLNFFRKY